MKAIIHLFTLLLLLSACGGGRVSERLNQIDSLVDKEQYDSAYVIMNSLKGTSMTAEDQAHYYLLETKLGFITNQPLPSDSLLDLAILYYNKVGNKEKLADAYYYKSFRAEINNDHPRAIMYCKEAERLAINSHNTRLLFKIAESLAYLNGLCENDLLELQYAKKALSLAQKAQNKTWIAGSYNYICFAFANLGRYDSTLAYVEKSMPYLDYIYDNAKAQYLTNIGLLFKDNDPKKAKEYFEKSLLYEELSGTFEYLADIYYAEGNKEKAYSLWKKALSTNGGIGYDKDNLIHSILSYDIERGNLDETSKYVDEVIAIKDSIITVLKNDTIKDLQMRFDHQVEMNAASERLIRWQWAMGGAILLLLCLMGVMGWSRYRARMKQKDRQIQISNFVNQVSELELRKAQAENQVAALQHAQEEHIHEIEEQRKRREDAEQELRRLTEERASWPLEEVAKIRRGIILYEDVMNDRSIKNWPKQDCEAFIAYYDALDHEFMKKISKRYSELSTQNIIYLILKEIGKADDKDKLSQIIGVSKDSLRSIEFRIRNKEVSDEHNGDRIKDTNLNSSKR